MSKKQKPTGNTGRKNQIKGKYAERSRKNGFGKFCLILQVIMSAAFMGVLVLLDMLPLKYLALAALILFFLIIGEIRRYLRDNSPIRVSRSLRDTAYKAIYAKEGYIKRHMKEPTVQEIAEEIGIAKEEIVYALDAIQMPMSLHEPVYSDGQDALFVMDQVSDKKNKEENWIEELSLEAAMERLNERERYIITLRFFEGKTQMEVAEQINISQAQVSRLEKNALKIMRKYLLGK